MKGLGPAEGDIVPVMSEKKQNVAWLRPVLCGVIVVALFVYFTSYFAANVPIDADYAALVLEAHEMLHGNFFRAGWVLSGISFTLTDLPYFWAGVLVSGATTTAYVVAAALMLVALISSGLLLVKDVLVRMGTRLFLVALLIFLWVCAMPNPYWQSLTRAHGGSIVWAFIGLLFLNRYIAKSSKRLDLGLSTLFFTLSCWGDSVGLLAVVGPSAMVIIWRAVHKPIDSVDRRRLLFAVAAIVGAVVLGMLLDALYFRIGGADKNSFLGSKAFVSVEEWGEKISVYVRSLLGMYGADFAGHTILSGTTLWSCVRAIFPALTVLLVVLNIKKCVCRQDDLINSALSLGFVLMSLVFVMTDISADIYSARYIAYFPMLTAILMVRRLPESLERLKQTLLLPSFWPTAAVLAVCIGVSLYFAGPVSVHAVSDDARESLVATLKDEGLENGYSDYWNGSTVRLETGGSTTLNAIVVSEGNVGVFRWICKPEWYKESVNFVVVDDRTGTTFGLNDEGVRAAFGSPTRVIDVADTAYHVYVYDYDLSTKVG